MSDYPYDVATTKSLVAVMLAAGNRYSEDEAVRLLNWLSWRAR